MVAGPHFPLEMRVLRNRAYWVFQKEQAEETARVSVRSVPRVTCRKRERGRGEGRRRGAGQGLFSPRSCQAPGRREHEVPPSPPLCPHTDDTPPSQPELCPVWSPLLGAQGCLMRACKQAL